MRKSKRRYKWVNTYVARLRKKLVRLAGRANREDSHLEQVAERTVEHLTSATYLVGKVRIPRSLRCYRLDR